MAPPFQKKDWKRRVGPLREFELQAVFDEIGVESARHGATLMGVNPKTFEKYLYGWVPITRQTRMHLEALRMLSVEQRKHLARIGYTINDKVQRESGR